MKVLRIMGFNPVSSDRGSTNVGRGKARIALWCRSGIEDQCELWLLMYIDGWMGRQAPMEIFLNGPQTGPTSNDSSVAVSTT